jgi:hypothetical protein
MKRTILAAALPLVLVASAAEAGTLRCSFTEPWFTIEFDSATGKVTYVSPDEVDEATGQPKPRVIAEGARVRRPGAWHDVPKLVLEKPGKSPGDPYVAIVEMSVTGQGSDGMSDLTFPFEGKYEQWAGGCDTEKAPAYDMGEVYDGIGVVEDQ